MRPRTRKSDTGTGRLEAGLRLLYVNDVHYYGPSEPWYPKTVATMPKFRQLLGELRGEIDLLVVGGDCVNRGSARIEELRAFRDELDQAGAPYQVIAGNHDIAPSPRLAARYPGVEDMEPCHLLETRFGQVFGGEGIRSARDLGGIKGLFFSIRNDDAEGQVAWLEDALRDGRPALVFCHYPLVPSRSDGFCHTWEYGRIEAALPELRRVIGARDGQVRAWFCGHQHINSRVSVGRETEQVVTGALGLSTCCYRLLDIEPGKISVTTHRLPEVPGWLDDVMNPERSKDAEHPTLESYHWGNDQERDFQILW